MKKRYSFLILFPIFFHTYILQGQNQHLDESFGDNGFISIKYGAEGWEDKARDVYIQPDEKLVVVGVITTQDPGGPPITAFDILRFNEDGSPDLTFGDSGHVRIIKNIITFGVGARKVVLQNDGKILVAGRNCCSGNSAIASIARLEKEGIPDLSFGPGSSWQDGIIDIGSYYMYSLYVNDIALQDDGKLLMCGYSNPSHSDYEGKFTTVHRRKTDGTKDESFGGAGSVFLETTINGGFNSIAVQNDGKILLGGAYQIEGSNATVILLRLNEDGSFDTSFGNGGKVYAHATGINNVHKIALIARQPNFDSGIG